MNSFSFNSVIIIESISPSSPELYSVGVDLHQTIEKSIKLLQSSNKRYNNFICEINHINGLKEWDAFWQALEIRCKKGLNPIIHFVCHGTDDGEYLVLNNHDSNVFVPWDRVCQKLERINVLNKNNTFVTMCICHGFNILKKILLDKKRRIPFCGLISSPDSISNVDAEIRYSDFYISLLTNADVSIAFQTIIDNFETVKIQFGEDSTARYLVEFSDELFLEAFKEEVQNRKDYLVSYTKAKEAIQSDVRFKDLSPSQIEYLVQVFISLYNQKIDELYTKMRNYKFMFDIYPDQIKRFDFPDKISE